jgi:hypothetical protein
VSPPPSVPAAGRAAPRRASHCLVLAALLVCGAACGKKGAPLPPLSTLPRAPEALSARLQGDQVQIRFRIPSVTQSNVRPANLQRVDVYALTGPTVPRDRFLKHATVVASVPVRRAVPEDEEPPAAPAPGEEDALEQGALAVVYETLTPEALQPVVLAEDEKKKKDAERQKRSDAPIVAIRTPLTPPDVGVPIEQAPIRHYAAVGITRSGRKGLPSMIVSVSLAPAPPAPVAPPTATVREAGVDLTWPEPAGLRRLVQRATLAAPQPAGSSRPGQSPRSGRSGESRPFRGGGDEGEDGFEDEFGGDEFDTGGEDANFEDPEAAADEATEEERPEGESSEEGPTPDTGAAGTGVTAEGSPEKPGESFLPARPLQPWPAVSSGYHLYAVPAAPAETRPSPYSAEALPEQLTTRPLTAPKYSDAKVKFGDERCYVLRVAEVSGTSIREGPPSVPACVKVADVFPPAAPRSLAAVASEGAVSLIWEANGEPDLAGYLVLRSEGEGQRTQQLTSEPLNETTFRDTKVRRGARYVYTVIAVDTAKPPNRSASSNEAEVFAR